jgi:hypothetical protein
MHSLDRLIGFIAGIIAKLVTPGTMNRRIYSHHGPGRRRHLLPYLDQRSVGMVRIRVRGLLAGL